MRRLVILLQALYAEAERRGYQVESSRGSYSLPAGVAIVVEGQSYPVQIVEMTDRVALTEKEVEKWRRENTWRLRFEPEKQPPTHRPFVNGRLKMMLPQHWDGTRHTWTEGPRGRLEGKLGAVRFRVDARP
jgi:hypothetical protein